MVSLKEEANHLVIEVKDNGIGIEQEFKHRVFQMFTRLHNQSEYDGSGLGLAICKKIVEELSGEISIESEVDAYTIFRIDLPAELIDASSTLSDFTLSENS